jgi:hypothetical protein
MSSPTYSEIAGSFGLWEEYVDPSGHMTEEQFDEMTLSERMDFIVGCFGREEAQSE